MKKHLLVATLLSATLITASATPTTLIVRVRAKDAKFIGTPIGGAYVIIRNNLTGEILSKGLTKGISGDTKRLLQTPIERGQTLTDTNTAGFLATIDIDQPLLVDVEVTAPVNRRAGAIKGSQQVWLIPGKDLIGDGLIIELPGFLLDITAPTSHQIIPAQSITQHAVNVKISLTMLCGCAISKGGVWNADDIQVRALVKKDGLAVGEYELQKLSEPNLYEGFLPLRTAGSYELTVYAYDPKKNNTGVDKINFVIQ